MTLPRYESFAAFAPEGLPDDAAVLEAVERMIADLEALREAPVVDPYAGPAILSGRAAGVFFHEVLGHRVEGHRQKREEEGQTFKKKINERILPEGFVISFDPTRRRIAAVDLAGSYRYDNQGVPAQRVRGGRKWRPEELPHVAHPIDGFPSSNGHGRKQTGYKPVARQSNLIVEVANPVSREALKERLMTMLREQGKPFGLLFEDIQGGVTTTGRNLANAFKRAAHPGVSDIPGRPRRTGAGRRPHRHAADHPEPEWWRRTTRWRYSTAPAGPNPAACRCLRSRPAC